MSPSRSLARRAARVGSTLLALAALSASTACRESGRAPAAADDAASKLRRYTVRGELVSLPGTAGPRQLSLRHEAIDDFADASGKVVGMGSMVMPFDLAPGLALGELRAGDKVEVRFAVGWSPPLLQIEQLTKLPGDTPLDFRAARPPPGARP